MEILIKRLYENATLPVYGREASSGIELCALTGVVIKPGMTVLVPTGIAMAVPVGYIGLVWGAPTMVVGNPIKVTTAIIESRHRDEIVIEISNTGTESKKISAGEVVAQLLVQQVHHAQLIEAEDLSSSH
ncbi:hypothetical protein GW766_03515 [Candidatus Parcubacteria bacterium]|nr:hypothetical protein [Candidatus Parcubacteria bacterium]